MTLYIRDVPREVTDTVKERAAASGQSLSAYVAAALAALAARPSNDEVVARLRTRTSVDINTSDILVTIEDSRR